MVATDSYRLSVKETPLDETSSGSLEANVPARALQELGRIVRATGAETIAVAAREPDRVPVDDVVLSSRLIDGQFPNYRSCCPSRSSTSCGEPGEFLDVVRRISLMAQRTRRCGSASRRGRSTCRRRRPTSARRASPAGAVQGEELEIGFNPEFLQDGLDSAESDELVLKLISPLRPGLIESGRGRRVRIPHHARTTERLRG